MIVILPVLGRAIFMVTVLGSIIRAILRASLDNLSFISDSYNVHDGALPFCLHETIAVFKCIIVKLEG